MLKFIREFIRDYRELAKSYRGTKIDKFCSLQMVGRDEYKYWEGEKAMLIGTTMLSGKTQKAVSLAEIKNWLPPNENEEGGEEKRQEILGKICKLFHSQGITYEII